MPPTTAVNNALTFTSVSAGAVGNQTSIKLRHPQTASAALSVVVNGSAIVVNLATDSVGLVTSTATAVKAAIDAKAEAAALVTVDNTGASNGSGVVVATNTTLFLSGGNDEAFPLNVPVLVAGSRLEAARLGTAGTLPAAIDAIFDQAGAMVVVRVEASGDAAAAKSNIIGGVDVSTGQYKVGITPSPV
jgi:hypothetical protein